MTESQLQATEPVKEQKAPPQLDQPSFDFLMKEYDALRELFAATESSTQNIFNFYLTLLTAVVGAVVLIVQFGVPDSGRTKLTRLLIAGLLFFTVGVGSVYLSALSGRYAHLARYARGIDEIRRHLIDILEVPMPSIYQDFMAHSASQKKRSKRSLPHLSWLFPTGTYQFFVAAVNSVFLAIATWLFLATPDITRIQLRRSTTAAILIFLITLTVYNIYSHLIISTVVSRLNIRLDTQSDLPLIAGKQ